MTYQTPNYNNVQRSHNILGDQNQISHEIVKKISNILDNIEKPGEKIITKLQGFIENKNFVAVEQMIYNFLTKRRDYFEKIEIDGEDLLALKQKYQAQGEYYKKTLDMIEGHLKLNNEIEVSTNPAWFSLKSQKYHHNSEQQNYKIYKTIAPNNYEYIAKIIPLAQEFEKLAQNTQDDISLKIPGGFLGFLSHSDSLVVHFKKRENKDIIDKIIEKWLSSHFLSSQKREYKRTEFAKDTLETSFSEDISKKITNWIETYQGNYDNKILAKYGLQWALYLSQQSGDEGENKRF